MAWLYASTLSSLPEQWSGPHNHQRISSKLFDAIVVTKPLIHCFFFFANQLSDLSHAAVSKDTLIQFKKIKKEATMVNTDLALAALFMFLTLKSLFGYIFICIFWVEISCNLSNLSGPRLYWQKKGKVCVAWSENSLSIFAQME